MAAQAQTTEARKVPTPKQWKELENVMSSLYGSIEFKVDGYRLSFQRIFVSKNKLATAVYVDGEIRGAHMAIKNGKAETEEGRRFFMMRSGQLTSAKESKKLIRIFGKKEGEKLGANQRYYYLVPYWNSFRSLKKHLLDNNHCIELLD